MAKLPPISYEITPSSMTEAVDKENPFEGTWGVLRALKAEVRELQAALHAEQHMREDEVGKVRRELQQCREDLDRERRERKADTQRLVDPILAEQEKFRDEFRKAKANREQGFRELKETLEDEMKKRGKDVNELMERIGAEEAKQARNTQSLADSLTSTQSMLEKSNDDARHCISCLMQDVKLISDQLVRVTNTWQGFRTDSIQSTAVPMRPASTRPLGSRPISPNVAGGGAGDAPPASRMATKPST